MSHNFFKIHFYFLGILNFFQKVAKVYLLKTLAKRVKRKFLLTKDYSKIAKAPEKKPFWKEISQDISSNLWLPTSKLISKPQDTGSWYNVSKSNSRTPKTLPEAYINSLNSLPSQPQPKDNLKMKKIRLYPDSKQTATLNRWMGTSRWVYNTLVDAVNKGLKVNKKALREKIDEKTLENPWLEETPYDIRYYPVIELFNAKKSSRNLKSFKFRSKKDPSQSIYIRARDWKRTRGKYIFLNGIKTTEELPPIDHDTRLVKDGLNRFWICIPVSYSIEQKKIPRETQPRIISIDPGVRTFATCYDPKGFVYEWGKLDISKVFRLSLVIDKLISESTKVNSRKRKTCKRKIKRIRSRIRNLVDELHRKFSLWLCNNYDYVILPTFDSQGMVKRGNRKISSKTARKIMTMSHYRFRQHLLFKAKVLPTKVILVTEEFTSKTCGKCGTIKLNLGSSKVFSCSKCKSVLDRDVNGARNILIKTLTEVSF